MGNNAARVPGGLVGNLAEPIRLKEVRVNGVSASAGKKDETISIWTRLSMTSDERNFHRIADNFCSLAEHCAQKEQKAVSLRRAATILLVIRPDDSAELWVDTAAVTIQALIKRDVQAGSVIFESDVGDVTGMDFPSVEIGSKDRVVCLFREGWRFGLYFDFNPDGEFDRALMVRQLGTLHRTLRYRHLYDVLSDQYLFDRLIASGWFPFVELISEFRVLAEASEAGFDLSEVESNLCARFDQDRMDRILSRWLMKPHFQDREALLRAAIEAYLAGQPISTIKIILTEIEGVLAHAYRAANGKGAKLKRLLAFAVESAEKKAGAPDTLLFPGAFAHYLSNYTFADFDPALSKGNAGSRHAVGHGAAEAASYTQARALQALLTLDQIGFYT